MKSIFRLCACVFTCLLAGIVGSAFTKPAIPTWYEGLVKPSFQPSNWLFAPVWTTLYTIMGISALLGAIVIVALFIAILWMTKVFYTISKPAALMQIPYLTWVCFASLLNFFILALN